MFEYAYAYALAKDTGKKLSIYDFDYKTLNIKLGNQLKFLNLDHVLKKNPLILYFDTIKKIVCRIIHTQCKSSLKNVPSKYFFLREKIENDRYCYAKTYLPDNTKYYIVNGFFQSPKYFDKYYSDICRQFTPKFKLTEETKTLLAKIESDVHSVSLHVRRGDYVKAGLCIENDFYYSAIEKLIAKDSNASFYIFSDDIAWVKENLKLNSDSIFFVERKKKAKPFEDIWLMSKCRNNIIANSSFSWWGAYLNQNPDKTVVAPKALLNNNPDIMPEDWIAI